MQSFLTQALISINFQIYKISLLDWSIILCDVKIKDEEDEPVPRLGHSFTPASSNRIFMFGGLTNSSTIFVSTPRLTFYNKISKRFIHSQNSSQ